MPSPETIRVAQNVRQNLANRALTERQAKLYSQRLRMDMGQPGLLSFRVGDFDTYLDEALLLIQCALLEFDSDPRSKWQEGIKRAAEILEWLSQVRLRQTTAPLHLLAASAFQVAGYPAMALGHLKRVPREEPISAILSAFLKADFPETQNAIHQFWKKLHPHRENDRLTSEDLDTITSQHIVMALGTVCAYLRTGHSDILERALQKLRKLAGSLLHSRDPYSYFLARLTAISAERFVKACLWPKIKVLQEISGEETKSAFTQFARSSFSNRRALVWPGQAAGIERLAGNDSFALCTPTGSGKTTVATLAIVQALFEPAQNVPLGLENLRIGRLVLYLVPSRALAAEVEQRLAQDLAGIASEPITVTGLYGGIDWGPTDAWIQRDQATIVVCTFEKADALIRYLGILFLNRVSLVVVDEAHMVEQDQSRAGGLEDGSSRAYRLEQLGSRLLRAKEEYGFRILALSAVAARAAPAISRWVSGSQDALPTTSSYRSTRQMLGRLEVAENGQFSIHYDLMDGRSLRFQDERRDETPYVPRPFASLPGGLNAELGPEVRMRAPTFWASLQLAAERPDGSKPSVMISLTQNVEAFSATCATLIESWPQEQLPNYFSVDPENEIWKRCLASAADYFTEDSVEYKLLRRGIAVHHGKMPGLLARRLKLVIDRGYARVVIATSTLSEGVNIPVNFLLIPSVSRGPIPLSLQEFNNLIGRAGRPCVSAEGSALVVLPERNAGDLRPIPSRQWNGYLQLTAEIERTTVAALENVPEDAGSSPLSLLLRTIEANWAELVPEGTREEFHTWLDQTAVIDNENGAAPIYGLLDTLDSFLIAAIEEIRAFQRDELNPEMVELEMISIWRKTYAYAAAQEEERLGQIWLSRGKAISRHYPDVTQRRRIYKTSLSPRSATTLLRLADGARLALQDGMNYARWTKEQRLEFIGNILSVLSQVPSFRIDQNLGRQRNFDDWPKLLRWWLAKDTLDTQPRPNEITNWYYFVSQNFIYKGAWGLGSLIGLLMDVEDENGAIQAIEIADWPRSGLPWIAFWIKELVTWGTLDPVAAFLLARGDAIDRPQAEADALEYYGQVPRDTPANDILDPRLIRDWVGSRRGRTAPAETQRSYTIRASLIRAAADYRSQFIVVTPLEIDRSLIWIDSGGYTVARSEKPRGWPETPFKFDFELNVSEETIAGSAYQKYA